MDGLTQKLIEHLRDDADGITTICSNAIVRDWTAGQLLAEYRKHGLAMEREIVELIGTPLEKHAHKKGEL